MEGYIKTYRQMLEWEWYTDIPVRILFEHCLLKANFREKQWQGITIKRGSFITSYENLAFETGLTVQQVRTAINKLKSTGEITYQSTSRYSIITVNNWIEYQEDNTQINKQITNNQQTNNKQITTTKECKERKNDKNDKNILDFPKPKKIDPYTNPYIEIFKSEYLKHFGAKLYLTSQERTKIVELASDIEDFSDTIPIVIEKLKNIDFGFENFTPNVNWLLKDSNYTAVLNGTYDKQESAEERIIRELRERNASG